MLTGSGPAGHGGRFFNWPALLGYDFFISFKLGAYPAGTQSYASDLARRLREQDFSVFFSEEEAPPGADLDSTLRKALRRSRVLVVVASRGALLESQWVRKEVEEFRRVRPKRPVVPIDVDDAIAEYGPSSDAANWLGHKGRIWLDESDQAVKCGIASPEVVRRLFLTPRFIRANKRLQLLSSAIALGLLTLTAWAWYSRGQAIEQQRIAVSRQLAAQVRGGLDSRLDRALLLGAAGLDVKPTFEIRSGLLSALGHNTQILRHLHLSDKGASLSVAFSQDGKLLASGGWDGAVRLWDIGTGQPVEVPKMRHDAQVATVAFSPDGKMLASGGNDGMIQIWNLAEKTLLGKPLRGDGVRVNSVAFAPDSRFLATGGQSGTLRLWNVADGRGLAPWLQGQDGPIYNVRFHPNGKLVASASMSGVRLWGETDQGDLLKGELIGGADINTSTLAFSGNRELLASGGVDNKVELWDVATRKPAGEPLKQPGPVNSIAFSPDSKTLVSGNHDGTVRLWNIPTRMSSMVLKGHKGAVTTVAFSPDGKIVASGGPDGILRLWSSTPARPLGETLNGQHDIATCVAISPDGEIIVSGQADGTIRFWNGNTRQPLSERRKGHEASVATIAFSPDGKKLASVGGGQHSFMGYCEHAAH